VEESHLHFASVFRLAAANFSSKAGEECARVEFFVDGPWAPLVSRG